MDRQEPLYSLDLHYHSIGYQEIEPVATIQVPAFVHHWEVHLTSIYDSPQSEFLTQTSFIR